MHKKVSALKNAPIPTNSKETLSFICFAAYFMDRIPYLSTLCEPLRQIAYNQSLFNWSTIHDEAFEKIKETIITKCLGHFDEKFETELWVDASPHGCGAFVMQIQNGKRVLISCASKTHTASENNYSHIEKECKACVWACNKFKIYLLGKDFTMYTDNRSVALILEPSYDLKRQTTLRLQNWKSELVQYSRMTVKQITGESNIADFLSRCIEGRANEQIKAETLFKMEQHANLDDDFNIAAIKHYLKALSLEDIAKATDMDECLSLTKNSLKAKHTVLAKTNDQKLNTKMAFLRSIYNELSLSENGIIVYEDKIMIPDQLREKIIELTHEGHMGINSCKRLIRDNYVFRDIDKMVKQHCDHCVPCQANTDVSHFHPIQVTKPKPIKMYRLVLDFTSRSPNGDYQLIAIDPYTRYPFFMTTRHLTSDAVISSLKKLFKEVGVPHEILSDNGPAFKSKDYLQFLQSLNIKRLLITPEWPRANGIAERMMKNINRVIRCSLVAKRPWKKALEIYLNNYRATPHSMTKFSPNELMGFENKLKMPTITKPIRHTETEVISNDQHAKAVMKSHADKNMKSKHMEFEINQPVLVKYDDSIKPRIKSNKYKSIYDPNHYIIMEKKGTMITASRSNHTITRNCSFFRNFATKTRINDTPKIRPTVNYEVYMNNSNWNTNGLKEFLKEKRLEKEIKQKQQDDQAKEQDKQLEKKLQDHKLAREKENNKVTMEMRRYEAEQQEKLNKMLTEQEMLRTKIEQAKNKARNHPSKVNFSLKQKIEQQIKTNSSNSQSEEEENDVDTSVYHDALNKTPIVNRQTEPSTSGNTTAKNAELAKQARAKQRKNIIEQYTLLMQDTQEDLQANLQQEQQSNHIQHNISDTESSETAVNIEQNKAQPTNENPEVESSENEDNNAQDEAVKTSKRVNKESGKIVKKKVGRKPGSKNKPKTKAKEIETKKPTPSKVKSITSGHGSYVLRSKVHK
jgi:hypothetical protein